MLWPVKSPCPGKYQAVLGPLGPGRAKKFCVDAGRDVINVFVERFQKFFQEAAGRNAKNAFLIS